MVKVDETVAIISVDILPRLYVSLCFILPRGPHALCHGHRMIYVIIPLLLGFCLCASSVFQLQEKLH